MSPHTYAVAELGREITRVVEGAFAQEIWVRGEIRNLTRAAVGHVYFDLVDPEAADAVVHVVLLRANKAAVNRHLTRSGAVRMVDGIEVRIGGFVGYYATRGVVQLRMTRIDADYTLGRLAARQAALLRRLAAEDLLDRNGRLPVPVAPLRVGLVTSLGSAAAADFLHELEASGYGFSVVAADARVQGPSAVPSLIAALTAVLAEGVDVAALVRGGGSRTDLAAFDDEALARAVASAPVPVFTGIGHEVDEAVADKVAHTSFKTPTACAAAIVSRLGESVERTERAWAAIAYRAERRLAGAAEYSSSVAGRVARSGRAGVHAADHALVAARRRLRVAGSGRLDTASRRVGSLAGRLASEAGAAWRAGDATIAAHAARLAIGGPRRVREAALQVEAAAGRARALDPERVLARGWSITRDDRGRVVRAAAGLAPGDELVTTFADGTAASKVTATQGSQR